MSNNKLNEALWNAAGLSLHHWKDRAEAAEARVAALEAALVEEKAEKLWYATRMRTADPMNWHDTNDGTREIYRRDALITLRAKGLLPRESPS